MAAVDRVEPLDFVAVAFEDVDLVAAVPPDAFEAVDLLPVDFVAPVLAVLLLAVVDLAAVDFDAVALAVPPFA